MDFKRRPVSLREQRKAFKMNARNYEDSRNQDMLSAYPVALQFYSVAPQNQISLHHFENLALERLQLLRIFERQSTTSTTKFSTQWKENIEGDLRKQSLDSFNRIYDSSDALFNRQKDHFSHFILRLAYSRTEELRRWFISQEVDLFRFRFMSCSADDIEQFMSHNDLGFIPIDEHEKEAVMEDLMNSTYMNKSVDSIRFFKVHFTEALDLVRHRKVFVRDGMCYVPDTDMISLLTWMFKSLLAQNLALTSKILPNLDEDERLVKILSDLDKRYTGSDYSNGSSSITPEMIVPLSERAFPLCMRSIQHVLNSTHHIKYKARLQYGLFLKGIGLSLDDALRFFRNEFTKAHIDSAKFDKEYAYGIRYNYGKEGKKVNWTPWSCMRIIMDSVGAGDQHGCPFRHFDMDALRKTLLANANGVIGEEGFDVETILKAAKDGHFQKSCGLHFAAINKGVELSTIVTNHPNQFYIETVNGPPVQQGHTSKSNLKTERVLYFNTVEK